MSIRKRGVVLVACIGALSACSWSRFDELTENAPVELLEDPDELTFGFGDSVSVAAQGDSVLALVTGRAPLSPAASFELGRGENPETESNDRSYCVSTAADRTCSLAQRTAGLGRFLAPSGEEKTSCFVVGFGRAGDATGVVGRCNDAFEFALATPDGVELPVQPPSQLLDEEQTVPELYLASDADEAPSLLAVTPTFGRAWFYEPLSTTPIDLTPSAEPGPDFGRSLAVARIADGRIYAVGDPERGEVWLFRSRASDVETLGCLGNAAATSFGRSLAAGPIDSVSGDELVIADGANVTVLSGEALENVAPSGSDTCDLDWLPDDAVLGEAACQGNGDTSNCQGGQFGASLTVADLDGDGVGEAVVGAPGMTVRGESGAGAVLVYGFEQSELSRVDTRILSSAKSGDRFGWSLATAPLANRDVIVAGAPGRSQAAVVYCSSLVKDGHSSRCE
jgi:hypothetical protein